MAVADFNVTAEKPVARVRRWRILVEHPVRAPGDFVTSTERVVIYFTFRPDVCAHGSGRGMTGVARVRRHGISVSGDGRAADRVQTNPPG